MGKRNGELNFDELYLEPDNRVDERLERSNFSDRGYRWQDDPQRYDPPKPKTQKRRQSK